MDNSITEEEAKLIKQFELIAQHFMQKIINTNYEEVLITEESWLSDFIGWGLTSQDWNNIADQYDQLDKSGMNYVTSEKLYNKIKRTYWDNKIIVKIIEEYGFDIKATNIVLFVVFEHIRETYDLNKMKKEVQAFNNKNYTQENYLNVKELKEELSKESKASFLSEKETMTQAELEKELEETLNPFFYAKHTALTFSQAMEVIEARKETKLGIYKAHRE